MERFKLHKKDNFFYLRYCYFILFFFGFILSAHAQEIIKYNTDNGLNASTIYDIKQDKKNFLWISTNAGLYRFDGLNFKQFSTKDGMADNEIFEVLFDTLGRGLLCHSNGGIGYIENNKIVNKWNSALLNSFDFKGFIRIYFYKEKNTFIISKVYSNEIFYLNLDAKSIKKICLKEGKRVISIVEYNGVLIASCSGPEKNEQGYYEIKDEKLVHNFQFSNNRQHTNGLISSHNFLYGFNNNIIYKYYIDSNMDAVLEKTIITPFVIKQLRNSKNGLWALSSSGGGVLYVKDTAQYIVKTDKIINTIIEDSENNIWYGTDADGLFHIKRNNSKNITEDVLHVNARLYSIIRTKKNEIVCGNTNSFLSYINASGKVIKNTNYVANANTNRTIFLKEDSLCNIWIGSDEGLYLANENKISLIQKCANKCIYIENNKSVYIGVHNGILHIQKKQSGYSIDSISNERTVSLYMDNEKTLWIGTLNGLNYKKSNTDSIRLYNSTVTNSLKINYINGYQNYLLLATDKGLIIANRTYTKLLNAKDGLKSEQCKKVYVYNSKIAIVTNKGFSILDISNSIDAPVVLNYNKEDGLLSDDVNDIVLQNDTCYAATNYGLSIFNIKKVKKPLPATITILNINTNKASYNYQNNIEFEPNEKNITIVYAGVSLINSKDVYYKYRLLNIDTNWIYTQENSINFYDLSCGSYTFQIIAYNNKNIPSTMPATLQFRVKPHIWEMLGVRIVTFFALLSLFVIGVKKRELNFKKREHEKNYFERKLSEIELEAIKAQINPHFIYNCLNSIQNSILKNNVEESQKQLSLFAKLIRVTLDLSKSNFISLSEEINYLSMYLELEKMRFKEKLQFHIECDNFINRNTTEIPSMLLQPFVENAIKHGLQSANNKNTVINVIFKTMNGELQCIIEDNGNGIKNTEKSSGIINNSVHGMNITTSRAETYNKLFNTNVRIFIVDKQDDSAKLTGTIIKIIF